MTRPAHLLLVDDELCVLAALHRSYVATLRHDESIVDDHARRRP